MSWSVSMVDTKNNEDVKKQAKKSLEVWLGQVEAEPEEE